MAAARTTEQGDNDSSPTTTRTPVPLTTIFTPPASCLDVVTYDGTRFWQGGISQTGDAGCYPSGFYKVFNSWFTPGICPESWTSVGSLQDSKITTGTDAMCCPSSYYLYTTSSGVRNACASLINSDLTNVFVTSTLGPGSIPTNPPLTTIKKADIKSNTVFADVIQVRWNSANTKILSLLSAQSATSSSESSSASTSVPASASATPTDAISVITSSSPSSTSSSDSSGGLSTGAEAGIGIGAAAVAVILALLAFIFIRRQRRRRRQKGPSTPELSMAEEQYKPQGYHELAQQDAPPKPLELDSSGGGRIQELPATAPGPTPPAELDQANAVSHSVSVSSRGMSPR